MVLINEVEAFLRSLPNDVHLLPYGNCHGRGSLITDPPCPKDDYPATAALFDLKRIGEAVIQIPRIFQKASKYSSATSYALKHVFEETAGYISNGDFIVAMALSGYKIRFPRDRNTASVNAVINCRKRDV